MSILKSDAKETIEKDDKRKGRNVVKNNPDKKGDNKLFGFIGIGSQFLKDCKTELKRVKWPTRKELLASTAMVLFLVILIALFLGLFDELLIVIFKMIALS